MKLVPFRDNLCSKYATKMLSIKINNNCNMHCSFCVDRCGHSGGYTDVSKITKSALMYDAYKTVIITGGEPFIDFDSIIELASNLRPYKDRIVLNTNGSMLSPDKVNMLNGLIDELQVSIHNYNEKMNAEVFGGVIHFDNIRDSLTSKQFLFSVNSTFNNSYIPEDRMSAINKMIGLCNYLGADRLRLTELKKVDESLFVPATQFYPINHPAIKCDSNSLITNGCTYYYMQDGIRVSVKRLCQYAKGKNASAFSCCFIDNNGQTKIDVDTENTFKVIYSNGLVTNDWIFNGVIK